MSKSPDAFRTISEVAEWLDRPAHVLRFWESKFTQIKPIKRAGGRRYYRPQDMLLLGGIKKLLHDDGMTIKGVQKMLREKGAAYVSDLSQPLDTHAEAGQLVPSPEKLAALRAQAEQPESATLLQFPRNDAPPSEEADQELSASSYEQAMDDYAASAEAELSEPAPQDDHAPSAAESEAAPLPDSPAPELEENSFDTPSFFDVFDTAPASDTVASEELSEPQHTPADAPVEDEHSTNADFAAEPEMPEDGQDTESVVSPVEVRKPAIVDVAVDAHSTAGSGILSRLMRNRASLATTNPSQLAALRDEISQLRSRLSGN